MGSPSSRSGSGVGMGLSDSVYERLLQQRIIVLGQEVDDDIANRICAQLLLLAAEDSDRDVMLYINSPGGSVTAGMAIYDTMQWIKPDVQTVAMGMAASMGQVLLTSGAPGKRLALPHAEVLMHQGSAGVGGDESDIVIQAKRLTRINNDLAELTAQQSGQSVETIIRDSDRDRWFTAEEAKDYGLIDAIIPIGQFARGFEGVDHSGDTNGNGATSNGS
ncbi:MAG: ATP-dependent Clp protease proteolytic subunit [Pseudonocardia sp.]|nr:ATP-dependent Clp protease proteolytic subunit [Pseudonocardia sp.]